MIARWVVGVVLLFAILLLMLPKTDETSRAKVASAAMLMCSKEFRAELEPLLLREEAIVRRFTNRCPDTIATLEVDEGGEMALTSAKFPLRMTLTPLVEGDKVRWSCRGEPAELVTKLCKP